MNKIVSRIIANAASAHCYCGASDVGQVSAGDANIECPAFQVQAVPRHFVAFAQKKVVVFRRTVAADDMNFAAAAKPGADAVKKLYSFEVDRVRLVCIMAAQQPVQFLDGLAVVLTIPCSIGGVDFFAGVDVVKFQPARRLSFAGKTCQYVSRLEKGKGGCKKRAFEEKTSTYMKSHEKMLPYFIKTYFP